MTGSDVGLVLFVAVLALLGGAAITILRTRRRNT
ncbi:LPXTG cell wall anchor domain-containing protein [Arthrobacter sp. GMC3]